MSLYFYIIIVYRFWVGLVSVLGWFRVGVGLVLGCLCVGFKKVLVRFWPVFVGRFWVESTPRGARPEDSSMYIYIY